MLQWRQTKRSNFVIFLNMGYGFKPDYNCDYGCVPVTCRDRF